MSHFARRYYDALRSFMDKRLAGVTADLWWNWPLFLRSSVLIAVLLVAAIHVIQTSTLRPGSILGSFIVAGVMAFAVALVALQAWTLWLTRLDATQKRPYVVALLIS